MNDVKYYWEQLKELRLKDEINIHALCAVLEECIFEITNKTNLTFSTFYVRQSYVFHTFPVSKKIQWQLFKLRKLNQNLKEQEIANPSEDQGIEWMAMHLAVSNFLSIIFEEAVPDLVTYKLDRLPEYTGSSKTHYSTLRMVVQHIDQFNHVLSGTCESIPGEHIQIKLQDEQIIAYFEIIKTLKPPFTVSLIDVMVANVGYLSPEIIVIEPDYLIDVTTVSEIAADPENLEYILLTKKFISQAITSKLLEGHAANLFLDHLIKNPKTNFKDTFIQLFHAYPLVLAKYEDSDLKELYENCKHHFATLKWIIEKEFPKHGINSEGIFIEPSFISPVYGIQGRLDIYFRGDKKNQAIVELKSGKPFRVNKYGLNRSHYFQTLLYDLLVKSVTKADMNPSCYILYSKMGEQGLKYAPPVKAMQYEALQVRNQILGIEKHLSDPQYLPELIKRLIPDDKNLNGFLKDNWTFFKNVLKNADEISLAYFYNCLAFISREHHIAKTGNDQADRLSGQASVWLEPTYRKEENFSILKDLTIREVLLSPEEPLLILYKSETTNKLANFRVGDIVILYPGKTQQPTEYQIFKSTIIELSGDKIVVRLRATQLNAKVFFEHGNWNIEPDLLDSSFNGLNKSVFEFLQRNEEIRNFILGISVPRASNELFEAPGYLIESQKTIYRAALQAKDYYLIWGPPGTGKTSQLLKALASHYYHSEHAPILIAAYTNRAADEICEAIEQIAPGIQEYYARIGARYSTNPAYRENLLEIKLKTCNQRHQVLEVLKKQKIIVGTLASISGKPELFEYYDFSCGIIDEASQVLEPMMAGLMSKLPKTILIGDHKQLPSIVTQSAKTSQITDPLLTQIGFENLSDSLFERLFNRCKNMNWYHAFGMLTHQGRMHPSMVKFPNETFYEHQLHSIEQDEKKDIFNDLNEKSGKNSIYFKQRISFIHCGTIDAETHLRTSSTETEKILEIVSQIQEFSKDNLSTTIGIITPFRAQIAYIRQQLEAHELLKENITIDTVERYQGGARDIIILSLCANKQSSLKSITSINKEGIDRKLNVALTRAKSQIIILGNQDILKKDKTYKKLIDEYGIPY